MGKHMYRMSRCLASVLATRRKARVSLFRRSGVVILGYLPTGVGMIDHHRQLIIVAVPQRLEASQPQDLFPLFSGPL